jgi:hypothetical protein
VKALETNQIGAIGTCKHKAVEVLSWEVSSQFNVFPRELYKGNYQPCKYVGLFEGVSDSTTSVPNFVAKSLVKNLRLVEWNIGSNYVYLGINGLAIDRIFIQNKARSYYYS